MKVIIYSVMPVIPPDYGGAVRVFNVARALSQKGIDVILVSPKPVNITELDNKIKYVFFESSNRGFLQKVPLIRKLKHFSSFFCFFRQFKLLRRIIKANLNQNSALILQSEYIYSAAPLFLLGKIFHLPLIITEHNVESELSFEINRNPVYYYILKTVERFFLNRCNCVICVSDTDKSVLNREYTIPDEKLFVAPNAADLPELDDSIPLNVDGLKREYGISADTHIVLFMGTLKYGPNLGAVNAIESIICPRVCSRISNVVFMIVGNGVQPKKDESIIFTGLVDNVDPYLRMADITIAPLTEGGGTRLKILEYMAYGKPVVSTSKGAEGLDVINNEHIIITDDWEEFSENIVDLLLDKNRRDEIGQSARLLVEEKYTWEKCCETYIRIYQALSRLENVDGMGTPLNMVSD